jgi:hypothetical protein
MMMWRIGEWCNWQHAALWMPRIWFEPRLPSCERDGHPRLSVRNAFRPYGPARLRGGREATPLADVLVEGSTYRRGILKERLYAEGLKTRRCEMCGQGETWNGRRMSLILDHVNGVHDDNRLDNLRVVCPNCAATLETHCGKQLRVSRPPRACPCCGHTFVPGRARQRFCSQACGSRGAPGERRRGAVGLRRVERPPLDELRARIEVEGYTAVAVELGVSDNAVRKWFRSAGDEPPRRYVRRRGA